MVVRKYLINSASGVSDHPPTTSSSSSSSSSSSPSSSSTPPNYHIFGIYVKPPADEMKSAFKNCNLSPPCLPPSTLFGEVRLTVKDAKTIQLLLEMIKDVEFKKYIQEHYLPKTPASTPASSPSLDSSSTLKQASSSSQKRALEEDEDSSSSSSPSSSSPSSSNKKKKKKKKKKQKTSSSSSSSSSSSTSASTSIPVEDSLMVDAIETANIEPAENNLVKQIMLAGE
jgi:hypothetical protein